MPRKRRAAATDGPKDVLTAREAAKYLRLALPTFYRYMWQGKIPSSKIGGRYRLESLTGCSYPEAKHGRCMW